MFPPLPQGTIILTDMVISEIKFELVVIHTVFLYNIAKQGRAIVLPNGKFGTRTEALILFSPSSYYSLTLVLLRQRLTEADLEEDLQRHMSNSSTIE